MYIYFTLIFILFELCVEVAVTDNITFSEEWNGNSSFPSEEWNNGIDDNSSFPVPEDRPLLNLDDLIINLHKDLPCLSCKGRCGNATIFKQPIYNFDERGACSCDVGCVKFGNCCPDIIQMCPELGINMTSVELLTSQQPITECYEEGLCWGEAMYSLINTCPYTYGVWERTKESMKTAVPVVDLNSKISYTNALCALCNGVTNMIPWEIKYFPFGCPTDDILLCPEYNTSDVLDWNVMADNIFRFHPPPGLTPVHWCFREPTIDNCDNSWPDDDIRKACEFGGQSYVFVPKDTDSRTYTENYKNYFCAICNYEDVFNLRCLYRIDVYVCSDPIVYSMQKLFSVNSKSGLTSDIMCPEGELYIETEQKCHKLETLALDEVKPFFLMNMVLHINDVNDLPQDRASYLISEVQDKNFSFTFYIGDCYRRWEQGLDYIQVGGKKSANSTQSFIYDVLNITEIWEYIHKYNSHGSSLIISLMDSKCVYKPYNLSDVTFDMTGIAKIEKTEERKPGEYYILNNTVYICVNTSEANWMYSPVIGWITIVSMSISAICLIIYIILYFIFSSSPNRLMFLLSCCLLLSHVTFLVGPQLSFSYPSCYAAGLLLHWAFLLSFSWMNAIAFDLLHKVSLAAKLQKTSSKKTPVSKLLLPFLVPSLILITSVAIEESKLPVEWRPQYGIDLCWFNGNNALLIFFVAPVALYVLLTALLTIVTAVKLWITMKDPNGKEKNKFVVFLKLSIITGSSWAFGFIAVPSENPVLFVLFVILNASQGLFLLLLIWLPKLRRHLRPADKSRNTHNSTGTPNTSSTVMTEISNQSNTPPVSVSD